MLSYLHEFHAGNHADILKHVTLLYVLEYLNKKNKPYSFFDTHAGAGLYQIECEEALKTGEASRGIKRLLDDFEKNEENVPSKLVPYLDFVKKSLKKGFYPGSPAFEASFACSNSNLFFTELHKAEFEKLLENVSKIEKYRRDGKDKDYGEIKTVIKNSSGWNALKACIPPSLKRGAVLCDPSYEELSDYHNAYEILSDVHKKWSGATILLWYPLLGNKMDEIDNMKQQILSTVKNRDFHTEVLDALLLIDTEDSHVETSLEEAIGSAKPRLFGSGMFIVQPSFGLKEHLESILPYLSKLLGNDGNGSWKVQLL